MAIAELFNKESRRNMTVKQLRNLFSRVMKILMMDTMKMNLVTRKMMVLWFMIWSLQIGGQGGRLRGI